MSEAQIPASEATEQMIPASLVAELLADAAQRYCPELKRVEAEAYANSRWNHDARLRLLNAFDPSPGLRERLENAVRDNPLSTTPYFELAITKIAAAVLVALGERSCPECAGASRDANGNESRFSCGTCSAALKGEPK